MDSLILQQPDRLTAELAKEPIAQQQSTLPPWHKPTITHIDIKRTMGGGGSNNDGGVFTSCPLCP